MTMRKREEIEHDSGIESSREDYSWEVFHLSKLQLEVLLDIRELLIEQQKRTWGRPTMSGSLPLSELNPDA